MNKKGGTFEKNPAFLLFFILRILFSVQVCYSFREVLMEVLWAHCKNYMGFCGCQKSVTFGNRFFATSDFSVIVCLVINKICYMISLRIRECFIKRIFFFCVYFIKFFIFLNLQIIIPCSKTLASLNKSSFSFMHTTISIYI